MADGEAKTPSPRIHTSAMSKAMRASWLAALLALLPACGGYRLPRAQGVDPSAHVDGPMVPGVMRLKPSMCQGVDVKPEYGNLDERSIVDFLKAQGFPSRSIRARADLVYVELQLNPDRDEWVRLRVALLQSGPQAGAELHRAELEHGTGSWGVHRSNLAVLGPVGEVDDIVAFVARTKLACWGVLSIAGRDDDFAIPGGYREL
jgi:hypothetical protein